jgi:hypothetical protein
MTEELFHLGLANPVMLLGIEGRDKQINMI